VLILTYPTQGGQQLHKFAIVVTVGVTVGVTLGVTIGVTIGVTVGVTVGVTIGITIGSFATQISGQKIPKQALTGQNEADSVQTQTAIRISSSFI